MNRAREFQPVQAAPQPRGPERQAEPDDEIDLFALIGTLWRGKFVILAAMVVAVLIGGYYAYRVAVPIYAATAVVTLESRQQQTIDLESVVSGIGTDQSAINTEIGIIRSRGMIEQLVDRLDLTRDPEFNAALRPASGISLGRAIGWLRGLIAPPAPAPAAPRAGAPLDATVDAVLGAISVANLRQSYLFEITAVTQDPGKSAQLANALAELYILDQIAVKFEKTEQATEWLSERVTQLQAALQAAEEELKTFVAGNPTTSPDALAALDRQIKTLRERRDEALGTRAQTAARAAALSAARETGQRAQMLAAAEDATLARVESDAIGGADNAFARRFAELEARADLESRRAVEQLGALESSIADLETRYAQESRALVALQELQRNLEASRMIYEYFLNRLKETSVQQGAQQADSRLLSRAIARHGAIAPRKSRILALSAILGLMAGAGFILLREMRNTGIRSATQLEKLTGRTVLGQIPRLAVRKRRAVLDYLVDKPNSAMAEALRNLRTSIVMTNIDAPPQVIMSTSSIPGEGKTTLSIALAQNLAAIGKKVLLVEGDIRRRVFTEYFETMPAHGLLAVIAGEAALEEIVTHDPRIGVDILSGEKSGANAADVFSSRRFAELMTQLRGAYDYIVIDTPPVLVVPDARIIGQSADAIIYCVDWDSTSAEQVTAGLRMFEDLNLKVSGLVLNQIDAKKMKRYGLGDGYGAYSGYGAKYYSG